MKDRRSRVPWKVWKQSLMLRRSGANISKLARFCNMADLDAVVPSHCLA